MGSPGKSIPGGKKGLIPGGRSRLAAAEVGGNGFLTRLAKGEFAKLVGSWNGTDVGGDVRGEVAAEIAGGEPGGCRLARLDRLGGMDEGEVTRLRGKSPADLAAEIGGERLAGGWLSDEDSRDRIRSLWVSGKGSLGMPSLSKASKLTGGSSGAPDT